MATTVCDFGNDYSLYLTNTDVETNAEHHLKLICDGEAAGDLAKKAELKETSKKMTTQHRSLVESIIENYQMRMNAGQLKFSELFPDDFHDVIT